MCSICLYIVLGLVCNLVVACIYIFVFFASLPIFFVVVCVLVVCVNSETPPIMSWRDRSQERRGAHRDSPELVWANEPMESSDEEFMRLPSLGGRGVRPAYDEGRPSDRQRAAEGVASSTDQLRATEAGASARGIQAEQIGRPAGVGRGRGLLEPSLFIRQMMMMPVEGVETRVESASEGEASEGQSGEGVNPTRQSEALSRAGSDPPSQQGSRQQSPAPRGTARPENRQPGVAGRIIGDDQSRAAVSGIYPVLTVDAPGGSGITARG